MAHIGEADDVTRTIRAIWASSALPYRNMGSRRRPGPGCGRHWRAVSAMASATENGLGASTRCGPIVRSPPMGRRASLRDRAGQRVSPQPLSWWPEAGCPARWRGGRAPSGRDGRSASRPNCRPRRVATHSPSTRSRPRKSVQTLTGSRTINSSPFAVGAPITRSPAEESPGRSEDVFSEALLAIRRPGPAALALGARITRTRRSRCSRS